MSSNQHVISKVRFVYLATGVLLVASLARLWRLDTVPPGLSQDEVLNADIVENIRAGQHALFFREGFGHEPLYHYFAVPFQILLGDNILSIRLPAVFLGLFLIALVIGWLRQRNDHQTAVIVGSLMAVTWWPIIFSRIGLRPITLPIFLVAMSWAWEKKRGWLAGLFLGLSFYTYTAARVFLLLPVILLIWDGLQWLKNRPRAAFLSALDGVTLHMAVVSTALFLPLQLTLWLDPTLQERVDQLLGPINALQNGDVMPILQSIVVTLGGFFIFGDPRWTYTVAGSSIFDWYTGLLWLWGLLLNWRHVRTSRRARLLVVWLLIGLLPSALTPQAPSIIRMIGVLPVAFLLPVEGLSESVTQISQSLWAQQRLWVVLLLGLLVANGSRTLEIGFDAWAHAPETADRYGAIWHHMAADIKRVRPAGVVVADSWVDPIDDDSLRRNLGFDPQARWVQTGSEAAGALVLPAGPSDSSLLYVPEFAPLDPHLMAAANLGEPQRRVDSEPAFAVYQLPGAVDPTMAVDFGRQLTLNAYHLYLDPESIPNSIDLITVWTIRSPLPRDLALFVHAVAAEGEIIVQHDGLDGFAPKLLPGDTLYQLHPLKLPADFIHQPLRLRVGVYHRDTGVRVVRGDDQSTFLEIELGEFDGN